MNKTKRIFENYILFPFHNTHQLEVKGLSYLSRVGSILKAFTLVQKIHLQTSLCFLVSDC